MAGMSFCEAFAVGVYRALIDPLVRPLRKRIVRLCRKFRAREILDIASATGAQCRLLARAGTTATGIDLSEAMIASAARRGGRNVRYLQGSAYDLPFDGDSFDASLLLLALHEHTEKERAQMLREAVRVVRPGGYLIIADYTVPVHPRFHIPWQTVRLIEWLAGAEHLAGFRDFVARGGLVGLLARHSLSPVLRMGSHFGAIGIVAIRMN